MSEQRELRVGSKVWVLDDNIRHYTPDRKLIHRDQWREVEITSETRDSWILGYYGKIPKKITRPWLTRPAPRYGTRHQVFTTQAEVDAFAWAEGNRYRISGEVSRCRDAATIRKIDELLRALEAKA